MKPYTISEILKNLTIHKKAWPENNKMMKRYSQFVINRILATNDVLLPLASELNRMGPITNKTHYNFLLTYLPKSNVHFQYINKTMNKEELDKAKIVAAYYRVPLADAIDYLKIMPADILDELLELYDGGK